MSEELPQRSDPWYYEIPFPEYLKPAVPAILSEFDNSQEAAICSLIQLEIRQYLVSRKIPHFPEAQIFPIINRRNILETEWSCDFLAADKFYGPIVLEIDEWRHTKDVVKDAKINHSLSVAKIPWVRIQIPNFSKSSEGYKHLYLRHIAKNLGDAICGLREKPQPIQFLNQEFESKVYFFEQTIQHMLQKEGIRVSQKVVPCALNPLVTFKTSLYLPDYNFIIHVHRPGVSTENLRLQMRQNLAFAADHGYWSLDLWTPQDKKRRSLQLNKLTLLRIELAIRRIKEFDLINMQSMRRAGEQLRRKLAA